MCIRDRASIAADWASPPILRFIWISAPISPLADTALNLAFKYPYSVMTPFFNPPVSLLANESASLQCQNVQLTGIPQCIFVFARQILQDRTPFDTDSFARIDGISIIFDNVSGILANATSEQLYAICVQNGMQVRYADFRSGVGSVLKLQFDRDIPLSNGMSVGVGGTHQLSVTLNVNNINPNTIRYGIIIIAVYEGVLTIMDGSAVTQINLVSPMDVLQDSQASEMTSLDIAEQSAIGMYNGGSIASTASNYIKRGTKFYNAHKDTIHRILSGAKTAGLIAADVLPALLGAGLDYNQSKDMLVQYGFAKGNGLSGGGLSGCLLYTSPSPRD